MLGKRGAFANAGSNEGATPQWALTAAAAAWLVLHMQGDPLALLGGSTNTGLPLRLVLHS